MRAIVATARGELGTIAAVERSVPEPGPGELRIRVRAVGLNPADWKVVARGIGPRMPGDPIGLDAAGVVDALGPGTPGTLAPGTRVCVHTGVARLGAFAERVVVPACTAVRVPDALDDAQAAALPTAGFTAWHVVRDRLRLVGGETVLVVGGSGTLGALVVGGARALGARPIATASAGREDVARRAGALAVFASSLAPAALALAARDWNGGLAPDAIVDAAGRPADAALIEHAAWGAQVVACNGLGLLPPPARWSRGVTVHDVFLGGGLATGVPRDAARIGALGAELLARCGAGQIGVPEFERIAFDAIPDALREMAGGRRSSKTVALLD